MVNRFVPLVISLLLFGLFATALITAGIMYGQQNSAQENIGDNEIIKPYYESINNTIASSATDTSKANEAFSNSSITTTSALPYVNAVGGIWKVLKNAPIAVYNLTVGLLIGQLFGDSAIIWITLSAIMLLIVISAIVLWITRGEGG